MKSNGVGYRKPPKEHQFKKGKSGNPNGRPKRKPFSVADAIANVMGGQTRYQEGGITKTATRRELILRSYVHNALSGKVQDAAALVKSLEHAERYGEIGSQNIFVVDWLQDYPGQTGAQKTKEFAAARANGAKTASAERQRKRLSVPDKSIVESLI